VPRFKPQFLELDSYPNHIARSLKTSRTHTLGIIVPYMAVSFFLRVIRGAEAAALQANYSLIAVNADGNSIREKELLSLLRLQRVEGILLVVTAGTAPIAPVSGMKDSGVWLVCLDRTPVGIEVDSVSVATTLLPRTWAFVTSFRWAIEASRSSPGPWH